MKALFTLGICYATSFFLSNCARDGAVDRVVNHPTTLLISMDGFRYDYLDRAHVPNIDRFASQGVKMDGLKPVFPSKTFPNHYTIVTGLYPEEHGIIANQMIDTVFGELFRIGAGSSATKEGKWFEGEPIWVTAESQGVKTATFFWPGSDAEIKGFRPSLRQVYNPRISYADRIDQVLQWLDLGAERPRFISLYFESPDKEGHLNGPDAAETIEAVEMMDRHFGNLLDGIDGRGFTDQVNIILLSDHGMSQLSRERVIFLDDYLDLDSVQIVNWSPKADIFPRGDARQCYLKLSGAHPHLTAYLKDSVPDELHYQSHRRIAPVFAVADDGWTITSHRIFDENPRSFLGGTHGYSPTYQSMWALFQARGPDFRAGVTMAPVDNVNIYELLCHLLRITPAPNSGTLQPFMEVLEPR